jgi:arylformamidase
MRVYDISLPLSPDLPVWPGDPPVELKRVRDFAIGDHAIVTHLATSVHAGTHVDAPLHFLPGGETVDGLDLRVLMGRAYVVHLPRAKVLDAAVMEQAGIPPRTRRVLFRTRNSGLWKSGEREFREDFVAINASGAQWLVKKGVQLVGVDYLSVAPFGDSLETHRILLSAGMVIVEGLDLSEVRQGRYTLYCLPLRIKGIEGAPARAILVGV